MPAAPSSPLPNDPPRIDEGRHHRETTASVRLKAQRLRRALDADRLDDAVKIAADVAAELRSNAAASLSPKAYYDVYLSVCAELRLLEMYVMESARRGAPILELYERVQETPLVLPRLYLLVTAGSVYVKSLQAPAKDVLRDLVEMCAGVQHPQRGLFLRAYLAQMMKDKLPDAGVDAQGVVVEEEEEEIDVSGGTVQDSIDFVIRNFTEMNRLWVRMQHDSSAREMEVREKERMELRLLVGSNIATLSRLVGANMTVYRDSVLPAILEQIVSCNDAIAQEYLADCVAQVFPDEFQLETLEAFMQTCVQLVKGVNMRTILVSIIDRLRKFAESGEAAAEATREAGAFAVFRKHLPRVAKRQGGSLSLTDRLGIYESLMAFALQAEVRLEYVDDVLRFAVEDADRMLSGDDERLAMRVLIMPLEKLRSVGSVLELENFVVLQRFLSYDRQRELAARVLVCSKGYEACISDTGTLGKLFEYVAPLVGDGVVEDVVEDGFDVGSVSHHHEYLFAMVPVRRVVKKEVEKVDAGFEKEQELVARIVYLCDSSDIEQALVLYKALRRELSRGGERRLRITMPSLVMATLRLAVRGGNAEEIVQFAGDCVQKVSSYCARLGLRLRLQVASTAAATGCSEVVYDNLAAALGLYEEIVSGREQFMGLELIIVSLGETRKGLDKGRYERLVERAVLHAERALTRSDQCTLLCACALIGGRCLERACVAARLCAERAERVLLLLDVLTCAVRMREEEEEEEDDHWFVDICRQVRGMISTSGRGNLFAKMAAARYQRIVSRIRFSKLDLSDI